jgi:hypothetical protein
VKRSLLSFLLISFSICSYTQSIYRLGLLPSINCKQEINNNWKLNYAVASRVSTSRGRFDKPYRWNGEYLLTDLSLTGGRRVGLNNSVVGGVLVRFRQERLDYRFLQQYTLVRNAHRFRLAHRFASDQTFIEEEDMEWRLRYRLAGEYPLKGQLLDKEELYLKLSNEYLGKFQGSEGEAEMRWTGSIGYFSQQSGKFEAGIDYRLASFIESPGTHTFWCTLSWYISI